MEQGKWVCLIFFMVIKGIVFGQGDSTVYRHGLPVSDDDTVQNFPGYDFEPKTRLTIIPKSQLPRELLVALQNGEQYRGWDKMPVYFDRVTETYYIQIRSDSSVARIGLNENGKPLTYESETVDDP